MNDYGYQRLQRGDYRPGGRPYLVDDFRRPKRDSDDPRLYRLAPPMPKPEIKPELPKREVVIQPSNKLPPKVPQVITTWKSRFIKAYMLIIGIVIITIGLFMIDESCGCIRKEDNLLSRSLKLYVFLGVIMLIIGLYFNTESKSVYIGSCVAFLIVAGLTLTLNSWIMKKIKEMVDSWITGENITCQGKKEDNRFLSYTIAGITVLSITVFTSIMLLVWVIYRSTKTVYTSHDLEEINKLVKDSLSYKSEMETFIRRLDTNNGLASDTGETYIKKLKDTVRNDITKLGEVQEKATKIKECMNKIFANPDDNRCKKSVADPARAEIDKIFYNHKKVSANVLEAKGRYARLR